MFCVKCGAELNEGAEFCTKCGAKVGVSTEGQNTTDQQNEDSPVSTQVVVMPTGTTPLVLGLLGMFGGFIPIVKNILWILSLVAIFVGASQRNRLHSAGLPSGKATAGMVLGIIGFFYPVIRLVRFAMFIGLLTIEIEKENLILIGGTLIFPILSVLLWIVLAKKILRAKKGVSPQQNENSPVTTQVEVMPTGTGPLVMGLLGLFGGLIFTFTGILMVPFELISVFILVVLLFFTGLLSLLAIFKGSSQRKILKEAGLSVVKATIGIVLGIIAVLITVIIIAFFSGLITEMIIYN